MRSGQDGVEITLVDATLGTSFLESSLATSDVALVDTASLEFGSAVAEIGTLDGVEELSALSNLLGQVMARVSKDGAGHKGQAGNESLGETHVCGKYEE